METRAEMECLEVTHFFPYCDCIVAFSIMILIFLQVAPEVTVPLARLDRLELQRSPTWCPC
jgi:hypothetical protein